MPTLWSAMDWEDFERAKMFVNTTKTYRQIICDGCGIRWGHRDISLPGGDDDINSCATKSGWRCMRDDYHYCPSCKAEPKEPKP